MSDSTDIRLRDERLLKCSSSEVCANLPERLSQGILTWCRDTPEQCALITPSGRLSYGELGDQIQNTKTLLHEQGVRAGDRVMLVCENSAAAIILFLALGEMSAISAVINARLSRREIALIRSDCEPRLVIYTSSDSVAAEKHSKQEFVSQIQIGQTTNEISKAFEVKPEPVFSDPAEQVLAMIYTTGTTGTPKGVMLTQRNLTYMAFVSGKLRSLTPQDTIYCVLPISHVFGLSAVSCSALYSGATLQLVPRFDAKEVLAALSHDAISGYFGVPAMYALLLESKKLLEAKKSQEADAPSPKLAFKTLRFLYAGGSPLDPNLKQQVEEAFGLPLHNGYGLTETGPTICQTRIYAPVDDCSVGYALPGLALEVRPSVGHESGDDSKFIGELWVRGPGVMKGYFRKPEMTADVLVDGWFNTGDLAYQADNGLVNIVGRSKELIIRSGFNVYPPEIEAVLSEYSSVSLCAVIGKEHRGDEEIIAFIQGVQGQKVDIVALRDFAKERLTAYKVPSKFIVLAELPASPSGKILKHKLGDLV